MRIPDKASSGLFGKYVVYFTILVTVALLASGLSGLYFSYYRENVDSLVTLQREKAVAVAYKIEQYVKEIERQIGWTALSPASAEKSALIQRRLDYLKLLRQVPSITEIGYLDATGREQLRVSRVNVDTVGGRRDFTRDSAYVETRSGKTYFGPVYFHKETEPYMTIASVAGRGDTG
jgi:hypothetical protein